MCEETCEEILSETTVRMMETMCKAFKGLIFSIECTFWGFTFSRLSRVLERFLIEHESETYKVSFACSSRTGSRKWNNAQKRATPFDLVEPWSKRYYK